MRKLILTFESEKQVKYFKTLLAQAKIATKNGYIASSEVKEVKLKEVKP